MNIANSWNDIDWVEAQRKLADLQYEILKAYRENDLAKVYKLQQQLVRSFAARIK